MELYLDTANINHIREVAGYGFITGVTTNPSLLAKEDPTIDIKQRILEIHSLVGGHLSVEVNSLETQGMISEADQILSWFPDATIKIPMLPAGLGAVKQLYDREIATNVTLVFNPTQALAAANAGATYVSVFMGRLDDIAVDSYALMNEICELWDKQGLEAMLIAASIRNPNHITQAAKAGCDIATVPYNVLMQSLKHPLTTAGIDAFVADYDRMQTERTKVLAK